MMSDIKEISAIKGRITVLRAGVEGSESFDFIAPAIVGRFDPSVGPVEIDLGTIPEGSYVSRKHAKFDLNENGFTLEDVGSSNGTFILQGDFVKIETPTNISDGDQVAFGNARFVFNIIADTVTAEDENDPLGDEFKKGENVKMENEPTETN